MLRLHSRCCLPEVHRRETLLASSELVVDTASLSAALLLNHPSAEILNTDPSVLDKSGTPFMESNAGNCVVAPLYHWERRHGPVPP